MTNEEFIRMQMGNQRIVKDITSEVTISPSPYDVEAYAKWKKEKELRKKETALVLKEKKQ
jgi:hypothetical protein